MTESSESIRLLHRHKMLETMLKAKERTVREMVQECGTIRIQMNALENELAKQRGCGV